MITITIQFLAGRFHATPWGRHVNEGVPEWPPAPWRILRSLIATWKTKCPQISHDMAKNILGKLAESPEYGLPSATFSHTRHYMPWDKNYAGHTTLVFDTFVNVLPESEIAVCWPEANLIEEERRVLKDWLTQVGYLGRAESWCEMKLLKDADADQRISQINCRPLGTRNPDPGTEIVRVLCLEPATAFLATSTPKTTVKTGKGKSMQEVVTSHYDPDWHICGETLWLHAEKWAEPPGSRWIRYTRKDDCFAVSSRRKPKNTTNAVRPQIVRFALDSSVLPLVTATLPVAEAFRRNLMGIHGRMTERDGVRGKSAVFSGKDDAGILTTSHGHAYFLPTDEDNDGRLDHVTLVAEDGFGPDEMAAIYALRDLRTKESADSGHALGVLLLGTAMQTDSKQQGSNASASVWKSATPYLCHRHPKTRGSKKDRAEELASHAVFTEARLREDIARLLARREDLKGISLDQIEISPCVDENGVFRLGARKNRPIEFQRFRQKHGDDGGKRLCGAFVITFPCEVRGPIALGHSCHFGMGLFANH